MSKSMSVHTRVNATISTLRSTVHKKSSRMLLWSSAKTKLLRKATRIERFKKIGKAPSKSRYCRPLLARSRRKKCAPPWFSSSHGMNLRLPFPFA
eukprot:3975956-Pleurochrysis_carterae.AAC.2